MACLLFLGCSLLGCSLLSGRLLFPLGLLFFICGASDAIFVLFFGFLLILSLFSLSILYQENKNGPDLLLGCTFLGSGGFLFGFFFEFFIRASWDIVKILSEVFARFFARFGLNKRSSNKIGGNNAS